MTRRSRIVGFGSAALLVLVGGVCTVALSGIASDVALGVLGLGVVLAVSLVFLEVGFSEDRDRAREAEGAARERAARERAARSTRPAPRRLDRLRGRPRRLR